MAAPLRQVYDQMLEPKWVIAMGACASSGGMFNNYTVAPGRRQDRPGRHPRPRLPAAPRGADGGHRPPPREDPRRRAAGVRDPRGRGMTLRGRPGLVETIEAHGETTLVIDPARIVEACTHLRDAEGFNVLVDLSGVDYLGWGVDGRRRLHRDPRRARPERRGLAGLPARPDAEAEAVHRRLPPARARRRPCPPAPRGVARRRRGDRLRRRRLAVGRLERARGVRPVRDHLPRATRTSSGS